MSILILLNKPYKVLSQFTDDNGRDNLAHYIKKPNFYPAGRLDFDSEGLLLLTDDGNLQHHIAHPSHKLPKTYWVQVDGPPNTVAIEQLKKGVLLKDGPTKPAKVMPIAEPILWDRDPPVRFRQAIPTHWLEITITEGRNRQIRRMTAAVNLPTLRLIRISIGDWKLDQLLPGEFSTITHYLPTIGVASKKRKHSRPFNPTKNVKYKTNHRDKYDK